MQPRPLIFEHLWDLYRHLRISTQLQPSICRIDMNDGPHIFVFDGQHKAAARIWAGFSKIESKIYIEPDKIKLIETNLVAHDKLKQLKLYPSKVADILNQLYGVNWQRYIETTNIKSEKGFCDYIRFSDDKSNPKPEKQIEAFLMTSIKEDRNNRFWQFVAPHDKTGKLYAMSWDSMKKYYFRYFLAEPPLHIEINSKEDFRDQEIRNNIRLLNILADELLIDKRNPLEANESHKNAERIFRPGSTMVWLPMLSNIIFNQLGIINPNDSKCLLFRDISEEKWININNYIKKMFSHRISIERDPNIDLILGYKKKEPIQKLFSEKGFTIPWILGLELT